MPMEPVDAVAPGTAGPSVLTSDGLAVPNMKLARVAAAGARHPRTVTSNTTKEDLVLAYVENFRKQFVQLYPTRPPLLLTPPNEAGVSKFVCTTIRPTLAPFRELYDLQGAARFVASYIKYEPLENPTELPPCLPSPGFTVAQRVGDAFEMATVLASFLIGCGYDAYVVSGTAPRWVTLRDESSAPCPFVPPKDAVDRATHADPALLCKAAPSSGAAASAAASASKTGVAAGTGDATLSSTVPSELKKKYRQVSSPPIKSKYLAAAKAKEAAARKAEEDAVLAYLSDEDEEEGGEEGGGKGAASAPAADPLEGKRLHAWVLVRAGARGVDAHTFLEPSTGLSYPVTEAPYTSVESVWNHANYYINMQGQSFLPAVNAGLSGRGGAGTAAGTARALDFDAPARSSLVINGGGGLGVLAVGQDGLPLPPGALEEGAGGGSMPSTRGGGRSARSGRGDPLVLQATSTTTGASTTLTVSGGPRTALFSPFMAKDPGLGGPIDAVGIPAGAPRVDGPGLQAVLAARAAGGSGAEDDSAGDPRDPYAPKPTLASHQPGSALSWRREMEATKRKFQDELAKTLSAEMARLAAITVSSLSWAFDDEGCWEYVMITDTHVAGARAAAAAGGGEDGGDGARSSRRGGRGVAFDGNVDAYRRVDPSSLPSLFGSGRSGSPGPSTGREARAATWASGAGGDGLDADGLDGLGSPRPGTGEGKGGAGGAPYSPLKPGQPLGTLIASEPLATGPYANEPVELDGDHVLDLPGAGWSPRLLLDRYVARDVYGPLNQRVTFHAGARLEQFTPFTHPRGLITRCTTYADAATRLRPTCVVEVYSRRKDALYKRVRHPEQHIIEEHFEPGRFAGLAALITQQGKWRDMFFYPGSRIDGLLRRKETFGRKIQEWYGETPTRLWYRSIWVMSPTEAAVEASRQASEDAAAAQTTLGLPPSSKRSTLLLEVDPKVEVPVRRMAEKYRPSPAAVAVGAAALAANADAVAASVSPALVPRTATGQAAGAFLLPEPAKIVSLVTEDAFLVYYHPAPGRTLVTSRTYNRFTGAAETVTADPLLPPPRPYDLQQEFKRLVQGEKDCIGLARAQARAALDILASRATEEAGDHVNLERTLHERAIDRVRSGYPLEDEVDATAEDGDKDIDYLLPFLLATKCPDVNAPAEKDARKADRDCRAAYKERLLERVAIIQRRLDDENERLLRRQQAFSRNRDHAEGEEEEFERFCAEATFRIGILEQRLERQEAIVTKKYYELERKLATDPRLAVLRRVDGPAAMSGPGERLGGAGGGPVAGLRGALLRAAAAKEKAGFAQG